MRQYWSLLQTSIEALRFSTQLQLAPLVPGLTDISERLGRLQYALQRIEQCAAGTDDPGTNSSSEGNPHQEARDCFKEISLLCAAARGKLPPACRPGATATATAEGRPDPGQVVGMLLTDLELLSNELKRHHYTRAVHADVTRYADDTVRLLHTALPGQVYKRPGSEIRRFSETRFGVRASDFHAAGSVGPALSLHLQKEKVDLIDDDLDVVAVSTTGVKAKAGVQLKFGKLFSANGGGRHVASVFSNLIGHRSSGTYVQYDNLVDQTKAAVVDKGNRSWRWLHRSGDADSAGARYRQARNKAGHVLELVVGRSRVRPEYAMPMVNQDKSDKGAYNAAAINELTARVAAGLATLAIASPVPGSGQLSALAAQAYPSVPTLFSQCRPDDWRVCSSVSPDQDAAKTSPALPQFFNPVTELYPIGTLSGSNGKRSQRRSGMGLDAGAVLHATDFADQDNNKGRFHVQAIASVERAGNAIDFQRLRPAHTLLDPGYNKSGERARSLLESLEEIYSKRPKLHLHHLTETAIGNQVKAFHAPELQTSRAIDNQIKAIAATRSRYLQLVELAGIFNSIARDKRYRWSVPDDIMKKFDDGLEKFVEETFGLTKATIGEHAAFRDKLFADPAFFMIEAYDAISIAASGIGVEVYETKSALHGNSGLSENCRKILGEGMSKVDADFSELRNILDQVHLPISPNRLMRGGAVEMLSLAVSTSWKTDLNISSGFAEAPLPNLNGNSGNPIATVNGVTKTAVTGNLAAGTAGVGVTGSLQWKHVRLHGNTVRTGIFRQIKLNIMGVGLCAPAMEAAIVAGINRKKGNKNKTLRDQAYRALDQSTTDFIASTWKLLARSEMAEYDVEGECVWNYREPPTTGGAKYENTMQNVRFIRRRAVRNAVDVGMPLALAGSPLPVTVHGGHTRTASNSTVALELMGACPSYNILMFPLMRQALGLALRPGIGSLHTAKPLAPQYDFDRLHALFRPGSPQADVEPTGKGDFDRVYMLHKYFGSPETIVGTMEKFADYSKSSRDFNGDARLARGTLNEFHRFDNDAGLWNTIKCMGSSELLAPGNTNDWHGNLREPFSVGAAGTTPALDPRPRLTFQEKSAIRACRRHFKINPDMSSAERMTYFLGNEFHEGRVAFNAYCRVIAAYERINRAAKSNVGYRYAVRNRDLNHRAP